MEDNMEKVLLVVSMVIMASCATLGLEGERVDKVTETLLRARTFICKVPLEALILSQTEIEGAGVNGIDLAEFCSNS